MKISNFNFKLTSVRLFYIMKQKTFFTNLFSGWYQRKGEGLEGQEEEGEEGEEREEA